MLLEIIMTVAAEVKELPEQEYSVTQTHRAQNKVVVPKGSCGD